MDVLDPVVVDVAAGRHEKADEGWPFTQELPVGLLVLDNRHGRWHQPSAHDVRMSGFTSRTTENREMVEAMTSWV